MDDGIESPANKKQKLVTVTTAPAVAVEDNKDVSTEFGFQANNFSSTSTCYNKTKVTNLNEKQSDCKPIEENDDLKSQPSCRSARSWKSLLEVCLCHPTNFHDKKTKGTHEGGEESILSMKDPAELNMFSSVASQAGERDRVESTQENDNSGKCRFSSGDLVFHRSRVELHDRLPHHTTRSTSRETAKTKAFYGIFLRCVASCGSNQEKSHVQVVSYHPEHPNETARTSESKNMEIVEVDTVRLIPYFDFGSPFQENTKMETLIGNNQSRPTYPAAKTVLIVTPTTTRYRHLALSQPCAEDDVLEVGCSTGETSKTLLHRNMNSIRSWVGLDTSAEMIQLVQSIILNKMSSDDPKSTSPKTFSARIDALIDPLKAHEIICTFSSDGPSTVFVDIGGNRSIAAVLNMLEFLWTHFHPGGNNKSGGKMRQIVVKNEALYQSLLAQQQAYEQPTPQNAVSDASLEASTSTNGDGGYERKRQWIIDDVITWLDQQRQRLGGERNSTRANNTGQTTPPFTFPKHPLKAPLRRSPKDNTTPICRYHNYHKKGCQRWLDQQQLEKQPNKSFHNPNTPSTAESNGTDDKLKTVPYCSFDHEHCHWCLEKGHHALICPLRRNG